MNDLMLLDGGMGTLLQARGLQPGECPEDWNVERPEDVVVLHRAYVAAGSQIVYANTFGANRLKYRGRHTVAEVVKAAIANARRAISENLSSAVSRSSFPRVALDIGPTGRLLKPVGDLDFDEAVAAFSETIRAAAGEGRTEDKGQRTKAEDFGPLDIGQEMPDLVVIETMGDIGELKAAVVAAKECCDLPVWATVTLDASGKLLTGGSVECVAALLESLGVDAYGFNCGLGPAEMLPHVRRLAQLTTRPIIAKPNAGLPKVADGKTVFTVGPEAFAEDVKRLVDAGASIVGGCCGTTPEHIGKVGAWVGQRTEDKGQRPRSKVESSPSKVKSSPSKVEESKVPGLCPLSSVLCPSSFPTQTVVSSSTCVVEISPHRGLVIGERINPTGKKALKEAYRTGDTAYVLREAVKQVDAGAAALDVNCGVPGLDERALLDATVGAVQSVVTCPLQIDTADPQALERALRHVCGRPLVNSVNGKRESMDAVFPLVRKYGGAIVALCLDEHGIPATSDGRLAVAKRILEEGAKYGFAKSDFVFDALTLAVSADPQAAVVTLETVRRLTDELGVNTVLGVSNVSFGLPNRPALNNAMYALAKRAGLSAAIANPSAIKDEIDPAAEDVLLGRDPNCERWIAKQGAAASSSADGVRSSSPASQASSSSPSSPSSSSSQASSSGDLASAIRRGLRTDASAAAAAAIAGGQAPLDVIQSGIVPALEEVGRAFEKGTVYLPQLLMAADAAGDAFAVVKKAMGASGSSAASRSSSTSRSSLASGSSATRAPIVLATVKGDIHDIGKNIVRALLENYGFEVIDLGRDVPPEKIVETARATGAKLVGLSALMTTTVGAMAETIRRLKAAGLACRTCVGGAVVTQEFADEIGADYYAKDAMRTVRIAEELMG